MASQPQRKEIRVERATGERFAKAAGLLAARTGNANFAELFVAVAGGQIVAATHADCETKILATCSLPEAFGDVDATTLTDVLHAAVDYFRERQILMTTMLGSELTRPQREAIDAAGFQHAGEVSFYLCHRHRFPEKIDSPLVLHSAVGKRAELAEVMQRTCEHTLDLPLLLSTWSADNMLAHLESLPRHRPELSFLVTFEGQSVGTLLLEADQHECRLVYLGLVPEYRGRGWGHLLLSHALQLAASERVGRILLSVDRNNVPALRVYEKAGFLSYLTQSLYFRSNDV